MSGFFLRIVNMSISAGWLILAVLLFRLVFKTAPKWVSVLLWGIVAIRLLLPFSVESAWSLIPSAQTISPDIMMEAAPVIHTGIPAINSAVNPIISGSFAPSPGASANPLQIWIPILAVLWALVAAAFLIYAAFSYWSLRRKVSTAVLFRDNIFQSENVASPFVLGVIRPRIYLPFGMNGQDMEHVIAHERAHIRRKDHWWKPLGFLLLAVHWFNPLMWLAYALLCRDIELACDEKVIREMGSEQRADYTQALLACSVSRRRIAACPLAFGEVGVKERVKSVMNYKKPAFWIIVLAVIACVVVAVCFLTDPAMPDGTQNEQQGDTIKWFDYLAAADEMKWDSYLETAIPAFPDITFRWFPEKMEAESGEGAVLLYSGMPIWNAYFCDLNGDGFPELCSTISFGSGLIDTRVICYDYLNSACYELAERGVYDYSLRLEKQNGQLYIDKSDYASGTSLSTGRLVLAADGLQILPSGSGESAVFYLTPDTNYVSWRCLYMNPLSSYGIMDDSGCRYEIGENFFAVVSLLGESGVLAQTGVDHSQSGLMEKIPVAKWAWQSFPYTDAEWKALFQLGIEEPMEDIHSLYKEILYQPLNEEKFLLLADGDLLLVTLHENAPMGQFVWSIYSLINESFMGVSQWEYAPMVSSRMPAFRFEFVMDYETLSAVCTKGALVDFDSRDASRPVTSAAGLTLTKGSALHWSPVDDSGSVADGTAIYFSCSGKDGAQYSGTLYISAGGNTGGRTVYTATLVGAGLHLSANSVTEGGVVAPITIDAQALPATSEYDLRNGSLELSAQQLPQFLFFTNSTQIAVTVKSDTDFEGRVVLRDISQNNVEIGSHEVDNSERKVLFTNLTAARLYRIDWEGAENCTLLISQ